MIYCTAQGICVIFNNYNWNIAYRNFESQCCTPEATISIILQINDTSIKNKIYQNCSFNSISNFILSLMFSYFSIRRSTNYMKYVPSSKDVTQKFSFQNYLTIFILITTALTNISFIITEEVSHAKKYILNPP